MHRCFLIVFHLMIIIASCHILKAPTRLNKYSINLQQQQSLSSEDNQLISKQLAAFTSCTHLADSFLFFLKPEWASVLQQIESDQFAVSDVIHAAKNALRSANDANCASNDDLFSLYWTENVCTMPSQQVRGSVLLLLQNLFTVSADRATTLACERFETYAAQLPIVDLPKQLVKLSIDFAQTLRRDLIQLEAGLFDISRLTTEKGVLSVLPSAEMSIGASRTFRVDRHLTKLQCHLREVSRALMDNYYLQGVCNPFTRASAVPPLHICVSCSFDPHTASDNWGNVQRYDQHSEEQYTNRARFLQV